VTALLPTPKGWPSILLARRGAADPIDFDAAASAGAFEGLRRAIRELGPEGTTAEVEASGLRGRGGAGHRTAAKWRTAAGTPARARYVVANGYGADPGSGTDRTLLETDPYAVVEGVAIAAFAIGAEEAFICVRSTATEAVGRLQAAVDEAASRNFIGDDALGSRLRIEIEVRPVQGAYMLGEETVLLKALDGKRGQPEQRPPHPATRGFRNAPTVIQNVQTLATVPWILRNGAMAFAAIGAADAPGTVLVDVRGAAKSGVAEVPFGTSLRDITTLGGVPRAPRVVKAVVVGGPTGGILPPSALDTAYTFEALRAAGKIDESVESFLHAGGKNVKAVQEALWAEYGARTIGVMADGARVLARIWQGAWNAGNGNAIAAGKLKSIAPSQLKDYYNDVTFVESFYLDDIIGKLV